MKKMTILAVILALAVAMTACGSEKTPETTAAATVAPTAAVETTVPAQSLTLTDWSMHTTTWSSPNGATVHITATPNDYAEGQQANFVIRLESDEVATVPCQWDGTHYSASADLNAANGYCYYVVLTAADGTVTEVAVNTPTEPTDEALINMEASLASYCALIIEESEAKDNRLALTAGKAQVQAPVITNNGETIACQEAVLVLSFNGEELAKKVLTLTETDTAGLFEASLEGISFDIPAMENEQKVELTMNVTLTNGQILSTYGGNWLCNEEGIMPVLG